MSRSDGEVGLGPARLFCAGHLKAVRDDDAVEAHLRRGAGRGGSGAERVAIWPDGSSAGTATCAVITASTPAAMAARKGTRSVASRTSRLSVTVGRRRVRVLVRAAVAGEVLGRRDLARVVDAGDEGGDERGRALGVGPVGARADDGVARVAVDVGDGRVGHVDARGERLAAGLPRHLADGRLGVAGGQARERAGVRVDRRAGGLLPEAALHVGRDEQAGVASAPGGATASRASRASGR